jgi:hypothetical protein
LFWGIDLSFTVGIITRRVNGCIAFPLKPLEYLKGNLAISVEKIAHLLAPIRWQRWEQYGQIDFVRVAWRIHRIHLTPTGKYSKVAFFARQ